MSPALYDLTSLQREANGRFGFSAKTTLALAQTLYERHKALTYPRTDSRYLPEDYLNTVKETMRALAQGGSNAVGGLARHAGTVVGEGWVKPNRRIFDNKKVSDHFAIIPTLQIPHDLSEAEGKLYDLVLKRFLAVFFPAAEYRVTTRMTEVQGHRFRTDGKVLVAPGWLAVYGKEAQGEDANLVPVADGETVRTEDVEAVGLTTKPPARYNEGTLLSAMEGAGKLVDDEELREAMSERGLGTPATRAAIIEGLLNESYLRREGRDLVPTAKARQLMTLLSGLDVTELTSPELTGEWEHKLKQIEQGGLGREAFMREIAQMTQVIVKRAKEYERDTVPGDYATLRTPCPKCGAVVRKTTGALPAPAAISRSANTRAGAPSNCRKSRNCWPSARSARCKASSARWAGPSPPSCASATRTSWNSTSARTTRTTPKPWTSPATRRSAPAQVLVARLRARHELRLREVRGSGQDLRFPFRQGHPAAGNLARADGKAADRRPHRPARRFRLQPHQPQVQGLPGAPARRQDRLRVRAPS